MLAALANILFPTKTNEEIPGPVFIEEINEAVEVDALVAPIFTTNKSGSAATAESPEIKAMPCRTSIGVSGIDKEICNDMDVIVGTVELPIKSCEQTGVLATGTLNGNEISVDEAPTKLLLATKFSIRPCARSNDCCAE